MIFSTLWHHSATLWCDSKFRYLGTNVARSHLLLFPEADVQLVVGCGHWETHEIIAPSLSLGLGSGLGMLYIGIRCTIA